MEQSELTIIKILYPKAEDLHFKILPRYARLSFPPELGIYGQLVNFTIQSL